jgi:hypothetical protein
MGGKYEALRENKVKMWELRGKRSTRTQNRRKNLMKNMNGKICFGRLLLLLLCNYVLFYRVNALL